MTKKQKVLLGSAPALLVAGAFAVGGVGNSEAPTAAEAVETQLTDVTPIKADALTPIPGAPEYQYQFTPNQLLYDESLRSGNYYDLQAFDNLTDVYRLAEEVRTRQALERIADALEAK